MTSVFIPHHHRGGAGVRLAYFTLALAITAGVFAADITTSLQGAIAVLYAVPILIVARVEYQPAVFTAGAACTALTLLAFLVGHFNDAFDSAYVRLCVSLAAIAVTTLLALSERSTLTRLIEQARILELSHDTVIIRDEADRIVYWNNGAEQLYGWSREEAMGKPCDPLLSSAYDSAKVQAVLRQEGQWCGEMRRFRRDGTPLILSSCWLLRYDPSGKALGVIESSADLTKARQAYLDRITSEQRYSAIFHASGFAAWEMDWTQGHRFLLATLPPGARLESWLPSHPEVVHDAASRMVIRSANQAAASLFGLQGVGDLIGKNLIDRHALSTRRALVEILVKLFQGAQMVEAEVPYRNTSGRAIDVILRVSILPGTEPWQLLVVAMDVTERNNARARLEQLSAELAHAGRVSLLGQLAASIAHEVSQPLAAVVNYGKSSLKWLQHQPPDIHEVEVCLERVIGSAGRATDVINRVRALASKARPRAEAFDIATLVEDSVALIHREAQASGVDFAHLPARSVDVLGDRVQIQQVIMNLLMNGIHATQRVEGRARLLRISCADAGEKMIRVAVEDSGTGINGDPGRLFQPFFSTKEDGMGMGLSICQSIVQAHGGEITAHNNARHGATVSFTLPKASLSVGFPASLRWSDNA
jgi:PAS domain S-box-containing protein